MACIKKHIIKQQHSTSSFAHLQGREQGVIFLSIPLLSEVVTIGGHRMVLAVSVYFLYKEREKT
jgi:hypothetical protein